MIPIQYKIIAAVLFAVLYTGGSFLFGVDYQKGKEAVKDNKIIIADVGNHNEDVISLEKHTAIIAKKQAEYKKSLDSIPLAVPDIDCDISGLERVYNETIEAANSVHFEN